ncbi:MAG TPA: NAD(P)H-dependent glycerol-3-phosphate dehydrogenase [Stellaceae bacterium]|nr:NAD(P)H-dependent glycerol-3-phosphate dehydrogenase [Stellaceae bacterium]
MKHHVAVLGGGTMGTALAHAVASAGRDCVLWSADAELVRGVNETRRNPRHFTELVLGPSLSATTDLGHALGNAKLAVVAVRSHELRDLARRIRGSLPDGVVLVSATKGLEPQTNKRMSELLSEETGAQAVGAVSGPNSMQDIIAGLPTALIVAAVSDEVLVLAGQTLAVANLQVFTTTDLVGVELAGALKNIVAIAAGIAAGLELGDNARALVVAIGLAEIQTLAMRLGARAATFTGLAGIGDLFLTVMSPHSRNTWVGVELGRGVRLGALLDRLEKIKEPAEGINTVRAGRELAAQQGLRMPLTECVHAVAFEGAEPRRALLALLGDGGASASLCELSDCARAVASAAQIAAFRGT